MSAPHEKNHFVQVQKTEKLTAAASAKAADVESQAHAVTNSAKSATQASLRQKEAFAKAKASKADVQAAADKAHASFRWGDISVHGQ